MQKIDVSVKKRLLLSKTQRKTALQSYIKRVQYIHADPSITDDKPTNHDASKFNLTSMSIQTPTSNNIFGRKRLNFIDQNSHRRRISTKSQMHFNEKGNSSQSKYKTLYNNTVKKNIDSNFAISIPKNIELGSSSNRKVQSKSSLNLSKYPTYNQRLITQPNETLVYDEEIRNHSKEKSEDKIDFEGQKIRVQEAKIKILNKIQLYVQTLDAKGQQELNQLLGQICNTSSKRRKKPSRNQLYFYQTKIKQLIEANKEIVKILNQQLLSPKKRKLIPSLTSLKPELQKSSKNPTLQPPQKEDQRKQTIDKLLDKNQSKNPNEIPIIIDFNENSSRELKEQLNYQNQIQISTNQFVSEWSKSQTHKKLIYQKFRKTLLKKFPQLKLRQKNQPNQKKKNMQGEESSDDSDMSLHNKQNQISERRHNIFKRVIQKDKQFIGVQTKPPNIKPLQQNLKSESSPSKSKCPQFSRSLSKQFRLSKKNSLSKGSTQNLQILQTQDKKQAEEINFKNLIDFIFKRAFFYSISQKKIIENKVPYGQMKYIPKVEKKDLKITFIGYNSSSKQKKYLRTERLSQKKLRATGDYLIKNKNNIMSLQKEGNKSFDSLKKCLDDAVQDYLKSVRNK